MQTIITQFHSATNTKPSRISATASGCKIRVYSSYDHALNIEDNHKAASVKLCEKLKWAGHFVGGHMPKGMVFVNQDARFDYSFDVYASNN
jgi:hypothetical protein